MTRVLAYGADASLVDLECEAAPDRAERTHALAAALRVAWPEADVVVGAGTVAVVGVAPPAVRGAIGHLPSPAPRTPRTHRIEAIYDGPDLDDVARALGVARDEVASRHASHDYLVELLGFLPGFAYLTAPTRDLAIPRRPSPRARVPPGSVGVAASFTGIYPFASPGGWNLVARVVGAVPFDPSRDPPALFTPGDRVRFVPAPAPGPVAGPVPEPAPETPPRGLRILSAPACATVQDAGRTGQLGRGLPPSGPLDPDAFAAANAAAGNPPDAGAIEVPLGALEVEAHGARIVVSVDGAAPVALVEGERLRVPETERAVRYLAVRGGIDAPVVLGARATLLVARLGGHHGRPLRRGDLLPIGEARGTRAAAPTTLPGTADEGLLVDPGPHVDRFPKGAYDALLRGAWRISRMGDRVGVRLEGARIPRDAPDLALPVPMVRGAIEVTTDGTPIVLGPDHPTTGGYPVLAVLRPTSQAAIARHRPGAEVRFADASTSRS